MSEAEDTERGGVVGSGDREGAGLGMGAPRGRRREEPLPLCRVSVQSLNLGYQVGTGRTL